MHSGKNLLKKTTYEGNDYFLVLNKNTDDPGFIFYALYVTKGNWQVASPEIIASAFFNTAEENTNLDADLYFQNAMNSINQQLTASFALSPNLMNGQRF